MLSNEIFPRGVFFKRERVFKKSPPKKIPGGIMRRFLRRSLLFIPFLPPSLNGLQDNGDNGTPSTEIRCNDFSCPHAEFQVDFLLAEFQVDFLLLVNDTVHKILYPPVYLVKPPLDLVCVLLSLRGIECRVRVRGVIEFLFLQFPYGRARTPWVEQEASGRGD